MLRVTAVWFPCVLTAFPCTRDLSSWSCTCVFQTIPLSLELDKRACSPMSDEEPPAQPLLRDSTTAHCLSTSYFPSGQPGLNQLFPSSGYFLYYRTEGELCTDPVLEGRFFTAMEALKNKEEGQGGETGIWSLSSSCLVC